MSGRVDRLARGIDALGVEVAPAAQKRLLSYLALIQKWNRKIRLVGEADSLEAVDVLLVDSLAPLLAEEQCPGKRWIDVGSGAGLPGIVLAIARPDLHIVTLEPIRKKHAFQRTARRELGLDNLEPRAQRVEDVGEDDFDVAVSRATFAPDEWLRRGRALVGRGGVVMALANPGADLPADSRSIDYRVGARSRALVVTKSD